MLVGLAMTCLVTLYVYLDNTTRFANRAMQLVMKNMGHNLLVLPEIANPWDVYLCTESQVLFPDDVTERMSDSLALSSKYYVSVLQARLEVEGQEVLLTGIAPVAREDETPEKRNMIGPLADNETRLGSECARQIEKQVGDSVEVDGASFRVVELLPPRAMADDCRMYINLHQCQRLLGKPGQINFILAFLCLHAGSLDESLASQENQLSRLFPGYRQISRMDIAQGRYLARMTTQKSLYYLLAVVAVVTVMVIAVTGLQEVHDRRHETGILVAMGVSHYYLTGLYLVKILVLATVASLVGFVLGSGLAIELTTPFLVVNTKSVTVVWSHFPAVAALTCAVAIVAEMIPVAKLLTLDPNTILTEE